MALDREIIHRPEIFNIENEIQLSDLHTIEKKISSQTALLTKIETKKNKSKSLQPLYPV